MPQLPNDTKYHVSVVIRQLLEQHLEAQLDGYIDFSTIEVKEVDRLNTSIRITPNGGGAPRYISVKISESW